MNPAYWAILMFGVGIVLLVAELLLPTHGVLGIMGLLSIGGGIAGCFFINQWLGLGIFMVAALISPFAAAWAINLWTRTWVGRRLVLHATTPPEPAPVVQLGQVGVAVSEMRPMGECDFGDVRLEAQSELGIIQAGQHVKVVAMVDGRPTVRPVPIESTASATV